MLVIKKKNLVVLGVELKTSSILLDRLCYHSRHAPIPIHVGNLWDRFSLFDQEGQTMLSYLWEPIAPICSPICENIAGVTCVCCCAHLLVEMGASWTFCLGWPQSIILLISAFGIARVTGSEKNFFYYKCVILYLRAIIYSKTLRISKAKLRHYKMMSSQKSESIHLLPALPKIMLEIRISKGTPVHVHT
jgi:hypothetical protein